MRAVELTDDVFRVSLAPDSLPALRLSDCEIEAAIEAPAEDIAQFREVLAQVLAYGRANARPLRVAL
ncbi:hypothetical protein [Streptomyces sp. NPDC055099]